MRRYKRLLKSATGSVFAPGGSTINRKASTMAVTRGIINCFGLPTVSADIAVDQLKANVWKTLGTNVALAMAEGIQFVGVAGTVAAGGIPAWLVTGAINTSYVVPATCRLFLIMACDLTLVLARSFKEVTFRSSGQPTEKDVSAAARNYRLRGYSQHVHRDVKKLVPRRNVVASFQADRIQRGIEDTFTRYKDKLMEDVDLPLNVKGLKIGSDVIDDDDDGSTEPDTTLFNDVKEANAEVSELEAGRTEVELPADTHHVVELPADGKTATELPAYTKTASELGGAGVDKKRYELAG